MVALGYGLAVAGLVLVLARLGNLFPRGINHRKFQEVLFKLIKAGNLDRAIKLCSAVPNTSYGPVARALVAGAAEASADDNYAAVVDRLRELRERETETQVALLHKHRWLSWLALACALAAAGIGFVEPSISLVAALGLPAATAALVAASWRNARALEQRCGDYGRELEAELARSVTGADAA